MNRPVVRENSEPPHPPFNAATAATASGLSQSAGPGDDTYLAAVLVDQEARRQAERLAGEAQRLERVGAGVGVARQVLDADFVQKRRRALEPRRVDVDRDDFEIGPAVLCLQAVERRHFGAAWDAPGRPQIEQERAALEIGERHLLAVGRIEGEVESGTRLRVDRERRDFALRERRQLRGGRLRCGRTLGLDLAGRVQLPV